jgi:hypothetical protein
LSTIEQRFLAVLAASNFLVVPGSALSTVVDFESFPDSTQLTTQIPGLTFSDATVITAGITLNEFEFPPHSGTNVAFDDGGPMSIVFSTPEASVGAFFTYGATLTFQAFNSSNTLLATVHSAFSNNEALSGDPGSSPNEFLSAVFPGISSVTITGGPGGGSFTIDDLTLTPTTPVPEPSTLLLLGLAVAFLVAWHRKLRMRRLFQH